MKPQGYWTNPSVLAFAGGHDPVEEITQRARAVIIDAMQKGLAGPPFDPLELADYSGIAVVPRDDIGDARTVAIGGRAVIEFNPTKPRGRVRYSICHELAHTLFPDCLKRIRNRLSHDDMSDDDWQLEMLCNIGAAELLMPIGSFPKLENESLSIDHLMELRQRFDTSTEALLLRVAKLTKSPCCVFAASRRERQERPGRYLIDYSVTSQSWSGSLPNGLALPKESLVADCTAIGFTAKGLEEWSADVGKVRIECVGIPPFPGDRYPRVCGIATPLKAVSGRLNRIEYITGNATEPRGGHNRILAQVVNDKTPTWGAGFALAVRKKWPFVQQEFREWVNDYGDNFRLGNIHLSAIERSLGIVHLICQHGYGPSRAPRIRYEALASCLEKLADVALNRNASVHLPRIGCGQAGGSWDVVKELIDHKLCQRGINVTVYSLADNDPSEVKQSRLDFSSGERDAVHLG